MRLFNFGNDLTNQAATYYVMSSAEKADYLIENFKTMLLDGIDINEIDIDYDGITESDMKRIKREVEEWWEAR